MNLKIIGILLLIVISNCTFAQKERSEPPPLKERLFYGGSFGLQIGTYTNIEIAPVIGLWILPRLNIAAGPGYIFYKDPDGRSSIYGGKIYTEFVMIKDINSILPVGLNMGIFIHFENELLSLDPEFWDIPVTGSGRYHINTLLAGAGISQPIGRRSSVNMIIQWPLNESDYRNRIYSTPQFRVIFTF